jgi:hypothetical protein
MFKIFKYFCNNTFTRPIQAFKFDFNLKVSIIKLTNTVYNFDGDFYHGCPICYKENTYNVMKQKTMGQIYKDHLRKTEKLKNSKYNNIPIKLVQIWEHTFDDMCRNDEELKLVRIKLGKA